MVKLGCLRSWLRGKRGNKVIEDSLVDDEAYFALAQQRLSKKVALSKREVDGEWTELKKSIISQIMMICTDDTDLDTDSISRLQDQVLTPLSTAVDGRKITQVLQLVTELQTNAHLNRKWVVQPKKLERVKTRAAGLQLAEVRLSVWKRLESSVKTIQEACSDGPFDAWPTLEPWIRFAEEKLKLGTSSAASSAISSGAKSSTSKSSSSLSSNHSQLQARFDRILDLDDIHACARPRSKSVGGGSNSVQMSSTGKTLLAASAEMASDQSEQNKRSSSSASNAGSRPGSRGTTSRMGDGADLMQRSGRSNGNAGTDVDQSDSRRAPKVPGLQQLRTSNIKQLQSSPDEKNITGKSKTSSLSRRSTPSKNAVSPEVLIDEDDDDADFAFDVPYTARSNRSNIYEVLEQERKTKFDPNILKQHDIDRIRRSRQQGETASTPRARSSRHASSERDAGSSPPLPRIPTPRRSTSSNSGPPQQPSECKPPRPGAGPEKKDGSQPVKPPINPVPLRPFSARSIRIAEALSANPNPNADSQKSKRPMSAGMFAFRRFVNGSAPSSEAGTRAAAEQELGPGQHFPGQGSSSSSSSGPGTTSTESKSNHDPADSASGIFSGYKPPPANANSERPRKSSPIASPDRPPRPEQSSKARTADQVGGRGSGATPASPDDLNSPPQNNSSEEPPAYSRRRSKSAAAAAAGKEFYFHREYYTSRAPEAESQDAAGRGGAATPSTTATPDDREPERPKERVIKVNVTRASNIVEEQQQASGEHAAGGLLPPRGSTRPPIYKNPGTTAASSSAKPPPAPPEQGSAQQSSSDAGASSSSSAYNKPQPHASRPASSSVYQNSTPRMSTTPGTGGPSPHTPSSSYEGSSPPPYNVETPRAMQTPREHPREVAARMFAAAREAGVRMNRPQSARPPTAAPPSQQHAQPPSASRPDESSSSSSRPGPSQQSYRHSGREYVTSSSSSSSTTHAQQQEPRTEYDQYYHQRSSYYQKMHEEHAARRSASAGRTRGVRVEYSDGSQRTRSGHGHGHLPGGGSRTPAAASGSDKENNQHIPRFAQHQMPPRAPDSGRSDGSNMDSARSAGGGFFPHSDWFRRSEREREEQRYADRRDQEEKDLREKLRQQKEYERQRQAQAEAARKAREQYFNNQQEQRRHSSGSASGSSSSRSSKRMSGAERQDALRCLGLDGSKIPTAEDLKQAYRRKAMEWHPDRAQNHDKQEYASDMFKKVKSCYDRLLDENGSGKENQTPTAPTQHRSYSMNPNRGHGGFRI
ncbi:unnamed protein product [Amoebophrya sp. A120]|nr:unnamed protein product [Amoebophrya sp. A120]|eukprot:GSA120T00003131001.1